MTETPQGEKDLALHRHIRNEPAVPTYSDNGRAWMRKYEELVTARNVAVESLDALPPKGETE